VKSDDQRSNGSVVAALVVTAIMIAVIVAAVMVGTVMFGGTGIMIASLVVFALIVIVVIVVAVSVARTAAGVRAAAGPTAVIDLASAAAAIVRTVHGWGVVGRSSDIAVGGGAIRDAIAVRSRGVCPRGAEADEFAVGPDGIRQHDGCERDDA